MTNDRPSWLPTPFPRFFSNACVRREPRVTFDWAPTVEKKCWSHLAAFSAVFATLVIAMSAGDPDPIHPLWIFLMPAVASLVWLATNVTRVRVHISDSRLSIERFDGSAMNYLVEHIDRIELDRAGHVAIRLCWGEHVDLRLPMPLPARQAIVDEVRSRIEALTVPTYRVATDHASALEDSPDDGADLLDEVVSPLEQPARQA